MWRNVLYHGTVIGPCRRIPAMPFRLPSAAVLTLALLAGPVPVSARPANNFSDWATIYNARFGFQIAYPADILRPAQSPPGDDGRVLVSADGKVRMIVATFDNAENLTLSAYRDFLLADIYAGTRLDYQAVKTRWFVISGTKGSQTFYERVTFSCGGRMINSWAIRYPTAERGLYDRVVEKIAHTYSVGAGAGGRCGDDDPARDLRTRRLTQ